MTKVLFIVPPHLTFSTFITPPEHGAQVYTKKDGHTYGNVITEPYLGCLSLSSYIKLKCPKVEDVKFVDLNTTLYKADSFPYKNYEEFFDNYFNELFENYKPDVVCISSLFITTYHSAISITRLCKKILPNSTVLLGGGIPMYLYDKMFKECSEIDAICYGEGELPLADYLNNGNFENTSWITKEKLKEAFVPQLNFIQELDEIPLADYDLINMADYPNMLILSAYGSVKRKKRFICYMSSRGCTNKCTFCAVHTLHGQRVRKHSLERIYQDLKYFKSKGIEKVLFQDDKILYNKTEFAQFVKYVKELDLEVLFLSGWTVNSLSKDMLRLIKELKLDLITLPIESGNERVLQQIMKKPLNRRIMERVIKDCKELGMYTAGNIIVGLPGETKEEIDESVNYLKDLGVNTWCVNAFSPLVGSHLYDICVSKGYIDEQEYFNSDYKHPTINTEEFTKEYIEEKKYLINLELNFIYNTDIKEERYENALYTILTAIKAKPTQAIAHYYAYVCYTKLGKLDLAKEHIETCKKIVNTDNFWKNIFTKYDIKLED